MAHNPWDELVQSLDQMQRILIEAIKITSNALERIKHAETRQSSGRAFGDYPDPHPGTTEEASGETFARDWLRATGTYAESDRRVRDEAGGEAQAWRDISHDAPPVQARR